MRPQLSDQIVLGLSSKHLQIGPHPTLSNSDSLYSFTVLLIPKSNYVTPPTTHLLLKNFQSLPLCPQNLVSTNLASYCFLDSIL